MTVSNRGTNDGEAAKVESPQRTDACDHQRTPLPSRPIPDWTGTCPDCGERVKYGGGRFVTVREVNEWLRRQRKAVDDFRVQWIEQNPL